MLNRDRRMAGDADAGQDRQRRSVPCRTDGSRGAKRRGRNGVFGGWWLSPEGRGGARCRVSRLLYRPPPFLNISSFPEDLTSAPSAATESASDMPGGGSPYGVATRAGGIGVQRELDDGFPPRGALPYHDVQVSLFARGRG